MGLASLLPCPHEMVTFGPTPHFMAYEFSFLEYEFLLSFHPTERGLLEDDLGYSPDPETNNEFHF